MPLPIGFFWDQLTQVKAPPTPAPSRPPVAFADRFFRGPVAPGEGPPPPRGPRRSGDGERADYVPRRGQEGVAGRGEHRAAGPSGGGQALPGRCPGRSLPAV